VAYYLHILISALYCLIVLFHVFCSLISSGSGEIEGGAEIARPDIARPDKTATDQTARLNNGGHEQSSP